ncbi:hypothetical protein [[Clostridium] symbiosum]|jgi:hypothetical protein|uniref:hypothetical protein n=2 Tax=Clostridium symbiosum TaxID=1512 RepID=UPI00319E5885
MVENSGRMILMKTKYIVERAYPYTLSAIVIFSMWHLKLIFINSENMNAALDGIITMCALIIGFLGAILPVILGMKNESKLVKYVFEKDEEKLFLKYIKATLLIGILTVMLTITLYFRQELVCLGNVNVLFYIWFYFVITFLFLTYRCTSNMLELLFTNDAELANPYFSNKQVENDLKKQELDEYYGKKVK